MAIKKFLSESGFKHFVEKVIGKTDISSIGDGTIKDAVSSLNLKFSNKKERASVLSCILHKTQIHSINRFAIGSGITILFLSLWGNACFIVVLPRIKIAVLVN